MDQSWDIPLGHITTRSELAERFGGSVYSGGIVPSDTSPNVFLFTDPIEGAQYDYAFDGVSEDGLAFDYTGRGKKGDHREDGYNGSVIHHQRDGKTLRLFEAAGVVPGTSTKLQRYLGEYRVDPSAPFRRVVPMDGKVVRTVIVFRLLPAGPTLHDELVRQGRLLPAPPAAHVVPLEVSSTAFFEMSATEPLFAVRRESELTARLVGRDPDVDRYRRWAIRVPDEGTLLLTDLYDQHNDVLMEAKSSANRGDVRLALGQLLDYRRHIGKDKLRSAVVTPSRPSSDLIALLQEHDVGSIYETESGEFHAVGLSWRDRAG